MKISFLLFDGFTALDVIGGYEVLARLPGAEVEFFAKSPEVIGADTRRLGIAAWRSFADVNSTDLLYVPGGPGVEAAINDADTLQIIRQLDSTSQLTVGICNGVGLLAAAGLLAGQSATTNYFFRERLAAQGVEIVKSRYHRSEKYITGAGVSASIDTALFIAAELAGAEIAKALQLGIEYYPAPPYPEADPEQAPEQAKKMVQMYEGLGTALLAEPLPFRGELEPSN